MVLVHCGDQATTTRADGGSGVAEDGSVVEDGSAEGAHRAQPPRAADLAFSSGLRDASQRVLCGDAACVAPFPLCGPQGRCVMCLSDGDCGGGFCNPLGTRCDQCRTDSNCPAERPACAPDWEFNGSSCWPCRVGSSAHCRAGEWCKGAFLSISISGTGGTCRPSMCASDPLGADCTTCRDLNAQACFDTGGACESVMTALRQCYEAAAPMGGCDLRHPPSRRSCVPNACKSAVDALDTCLPTCDVAKSACP
jgi:hypothetical protein